MCSVADSVSREPKVGPLEGAESSRVSPLAGNRQELDSLDRVINVSNKRKGKAVKKSSGRSCQVRSTTQESPARQSSHAQTRGQDWEAFTNLDGLLASLPMALVGVDDEGDVRFWSNGCQQAFPRPSKADCGRPLETVLARMARRYHAPGLEGLAGLIRAALKKGSSTSGWQFEIRSNGQAHLIQADFSALQTGANGGAGGGVLLLQDVTARERLEDGTREVSNLASLGQLAACIAHEVRNPLSAVKAAAQLLVQENSGNDLVSRYASIIDREAARLERLVGDFLLYAKPPSPQRLPVSVEGLVKRCCEILQIEADRRGVRLECRHKSTLPIISADHEALLQALLNLGKNALEATGEGGKVSITAAWEGLAAPVKIVVRDTGSGIPRKNLERVLIPFFSTKSYGTGLGLPITKRTIELQGGDISLTSRSGRGTRVEVSLPVSRSEDASR